MKAAVFILIGAIGLVGCKSIVHHPSADKGFQPVFKVLTPSLQQVLVNIGIKDAKHVKVIGGDGTRYVLMSADEDDHCNPKPPCHWKELAGEYTCVDCSDDPWGWQWF